MRPSDRLLTEPAYLPYLPLIYVAWSDGELLDPEIAHLRQRAAVDLAPGIDDAPVLASWLDPDQPPGATDLLRILRRIRTLAVRLPPTDRSSLVELGLAMASLEGNRSTPPVARAVAELELALELSGHDALRTVLRDAGVPVVLEAPTTAILSMERSCAALRTSSSSASPMAPSDGSAPTEPTEVEARRSRIAPFLSSCSRPARAS